MNDYLLSSTDNQTPIRSHKKQSFRELFSLQNYFTYFPLPDIVQNPFIHPCFKKTEMFCWHRVPLKYFKRLLSKMNIENALRGLTSITTQSKQLDGILNASGHHVKYKLQVHTFASAFPYASHQNTSLEGVHKTQYTCLHRNREIRHKEGQARDQVQPLHTADLRVVSGLVSFLSLQR